MMRILDLITRRRPRLSASPKPWPETEASLAERRANRRAMSSAARAGAATKIHETYQRDALINQRSTAA